jgi:hypothetical protein
MGEQPRKRDFWEKISLVLQSSGGLFTAITVAIIGLIGSSYLKDREMKENSYRQEQQLRESKNSIYLELTSKREEAESALRKDMFVSIIQSFLTSGSSSLDERVLNLELLSYNFHESLNLKPLFIYLERKIGSSKDPLKKDYLDRLYKLANEISRKQMLVLEGAGDKTDRIIDIENLKQNPGGFPLEDATLTVDGISRQFSLFVLAADTKTSQINVRLEIKTLGNDSGAVETHAAEFWIGYFDFPMIDNIRLPNDQRAAVVLNRFEDGSADVTLALFPGSYASLKDKASLQEVLQNLMKTDESLARKP